MRKMCSKRRHVRLLCLLGTSCEVSPSAATGGPQSARAHSGVGKLCQAYAAGLAASGNFRAF